MGPASRWGLRPGVGRFPVAAIGIAPCKIGRVTFNPASQPEPVTRGARDPHSPGVRIVDDGVDTVVYAPNATDVWLALFDSAAPDAHERDYRLLGPVAGMWHGHIGGVYAGSCYGFRAAGPWDPTHGMLFNPNKLLLDPYGRALAGEIDMGPALYAHATSEDSYPLYPMKPSPLDSAPQQARSVVVGEPFAMVPGPRTPWNETVIYEVHVKGFTEAREAIPPELRGTYAGLAHPESLRYLHELGVTAVELLPIHAKLAEPFLTERGLTNYWGYSTLSFFAPEPNYATEAARAAGPQAVIDEFRGMVSLLHEAGIEVILDVVYNHTCEGASSGPSVSWRGLADNVYYRLGPGGEHLDYTGCGNTVDISHPRVNQMVLDSLRYWVREMGIDGFRFDLAVTLGRTHPDFDTESPFFLTCLSDPILRSTKLIAEPWDIGPNGWRTGDFPLPFSTWNDRFRDTIRQFWLVDAAVQTAGGTPNAGLSELATRLSGSQDLYSGYQRAGQRTPRASVNLVTAHDGFTLRDLVCYDTKHNEANLEGNRDGSTNNRSWNHGFEGIAQTAEHIPEYLREYLVLSGDTTPEGLRAARLRSMRNILGTLLVSAGTPMILGGDEFGRTQYGNNNGYCLDNEITWMDWVFEPWQEKLQATVKYLLRLRQQHPALRPDAFLTGNMTGGDIVPDLVFYSVEGRPLTAAMWNDPTVRTMQMLRSDVRFGNSDVLVMFNGSTAPQRMRCATGRGAPFLLAWDSVWEDPQNYLREDDAGRLVAETVEPGRQVLLEPLSMRIYLT